MDPDQNKSTSDGKTRRIIQQIDIVTQLDDHQLLETQLNRMKSLLLDISYHSQDQLMATLQMLDCFKRMEDQVRLARLLIHRSQRRQQWLYGLFSKPKLSTQISEWKTNVNNLFKEIQMGLSEFQTRLAKMGTGNGEAVVERCLREAPQEPLEKMGIRHGEVVVERWLSEAPEVRIIGVCGCAGVGKTKLLQNIYKTYKVSDVFDIVIWVTVGQLGILDVQDCIARPINLDMGVRDSNYELGRHVRKIKLSTYLETKKFLLIFDDLRNPLDLDKLGVEFGDGKGSKFIFSSRNSHVIHKMGAKENSICIQPLSSEESWELLSSVAFRDGQFPQDLEHIARKVADECKGLPIAINVIAATMRGNTFVNDWNLAFSQMQTPIEHISSASYGSENSMYIQSLSSKEYRELYHSVAVKEITTTRGSTSNPWDLSFRRMQATTRLRDISSTSPRIDPHLYQILRCCYERLPDATFKSCFLYCAMFPEHEEMEVDKMVGMWIAEGIVESMDIAHSHLKLLVDRCFVQVTHIPHGMVFFKTDKTLRDVAIYIGKREEHCLFEAGRRLQNYPMDIKKNKWKRISFYGNNIKSLPEKGMECRRLVSLSIGANKELKQLPMSFLIDLPSLRVLDLSKKKIKLLPIALWQLYQLKYLDVSQTLIEDLSEDIGYLSQLQFLNMRGCSELKSLPQALGHLSYLQFLNVLGCSKVTSIPSEIFELKNLKYFQISQYNI